MITELTQWKSRAFPSSTCSSRNRTALSERVKEMNSRTLIVESSNYNKLWLQALFVLSLLTTRSEAGSITVGVLLPFNISANASSASVLSANKYASAVPLAVERVNNESSLLPTHQITFVWNDTQCDEEISVKAMLHQLERGVQAFIGPGCSCETQAKLAAAANIPMVSYVSTQKYT